MCAHSLYSEAAYSDHMVAVGIYSLLISLIILSSQPVDGAACFVDGLLSYESISAIWVGHCLGPATITKWYDCFSCSRGCACDALEGSGCKMCQRVTCGGMCCHLLACNCKALLRSCSGWWVLFFVQIILWAHTSCLLCIPSRVYYTWRRQLATLIVSVHFVCNLLIDQ